MAGCSHRAIARARRVLGIDRFDLIALRRTGRVDGVIDLDVEVDSSAGTYIRALARDVGAALGVGGHLTALRCTRSGRFGLAQARTLEQLAEAPQLSCTLDDACLQSFPHRTLTAAEADAAAHGRPLDVVGISGTYAATAPDGRVIALLHDAGNRTKSVVVIRPATLSRAGLSCTKNSGETVHATWHGIAC